MRNLLVNKFEKEVFFQFFTDMVSSGGRLNVAPDFDICDSEEQSVLEHALSTAQYRLAKNVLEAGANIDLQNSRGCSLMLTTIKRKDVPSALFLIEHGADINVRCVLLIIFHFITIAYPIKEDTDLLQVVNFICRLAVSLRITSFDNQLGTSLFATFNRLDVNMFLQAMRTHPGIGLL